MIEVAPGSSRMLRYNDAVLYCAFCRYGGYNDWRLPTAIELLEHVGTRGWHNNDNAYGLQYVLDHVTPVRTINGS